MIVHTHYIDHKSMADTALEVEVKPTTQFRLRLWLALKLILISGWLAGYRVNIETESSE